jgi:hypothetical protein
VCVNAIESVSQTFVVREFADFLKDYSHLVSGLDKRGHICYIHFERRTVLLVTISLERYTIPIHDLVLHDAGIRRVSTASVDGRNASLRHIRVQQS